MRLEDEGRGGLTRKERAPVIDELSTTLVSLEQSKSVIINEALCDHQSPKLCDSDVLML